MNHLNNPNKFEQKLREQFDDFEAKPNEALWDNIVQNLPTDNFEKSVAGKLNTLQFEPNESIWFAIEKRLPFIVQVNKKLIYLWTFVVLSFGVFAGFFINKMMSESKTSGALTHPQAFVWLENRGELAKGNKQFAIRNEQIVIGSLSKEVIGNKQHVISHPELVEGGNKQIDNAKNKIESQAVNTNKNSKNLLVENTINKRVKKNNQNKNNSNPVSSIESPLFANSNKTNSSVNPTDGKALAATNTSAVLPLTNNLNPEANNRSTIANNNVPPLAENSIPVTGKPVPEPTKDSSIETAPLSKVDSLMASPKNKTTLAQQVSDENYTGPSLKKEKLTIIAYGGMGFSYMRYAAGNDKVNSENNQNLREKTESTESEITGGFLVGYDLTKRFTISSGLILANFKQTMNFSKETAKNPNGNYEENMIYYNDSIVVGNSNSTSLKYSFTEVPIFITYKALETQKFELAFQTGLGIGFVTGINTYIINTNNVGVYSVTNKDDFPAFKNTLFFSFQPQFTYNLNSPGVSVGLMPIVKTSLTNIVSDENWLKQYPYNVSMNVFLRKRF